VNRVFWLTGVLLVVVIFGLWIGHNPGTTQAEFKLESRPQNNRYLFDYANILADHEEGVSYFLKSLEERFHIEALIVSLPDLAGVGSIEQLAVEIVNRWRIGADFEGRGLLLLLVDEGKKVKLEVAYELEDVFTDAYTGYVEDLQLKPYYKSGDLGTGLVAVMELLEQRAVVKNQGDYSPGQIARLDAELLAGGAGAGRELEAYRAGDKASDELYLTQPGHGARTPADAWEIMLQKWGGNGTALAPDIYTEMTKMAMGDQNQPDRRTLAELQHWMQADYQVLQDRNHAIIFFGNKKGWNNAPFLFCNTGDGWKFDIVYQRRLVVMGPNPSWKVEQGNHPYAGLINRMPQSTGKDIPMRTEDWYACEQDRPMAEEIQALERHPDSRPEDYPDLIKLARLNVITGRRPNHVMPLLKHAKSLNPSDPTAWMYAAVYNVNTFFQYETALRDIRTYIDLAPNDYLGHDFLGFLHYRLGEYQQSIKALKDSVHLNSNNVYAYCLLARNYALLYRDANRLNPRRAAYKDQVFEMLAKAETNATTDPIRVAWLKSWLNQRDL